MEPVQAAAAEPAPGPVTDSVEPAEADLQPETDDPDLNDEESGQMKDKKEEDKEKEEVEVRREAERCATPEPVKERNIWEHQEGMSTQQVQHHTCDISLKTTCFPLCQSPECILMWI